MENTCKSLFNFIEKQTQYAYIEQLGGVLQPNYPNKMCKLERSIYGLKQESRS